MHSSAKPSHYSKDAEHYDDFNEKNSEQINQVIDTILKKHKVKTVLDLTCGTGSQVFWLAKCGYEVTGSDINANMLKITRSKARKKKIGVKLLKGDMRTLKAGEFNAAITIFNAVGHLTKPDFEKAMRNIRKNLNAGGLYIFDIFNLSYLLKDSNITKLTIDWKKNKTREIQYSTINKEGVLASFTTLLAGKKTSRSSQTLQVYTAKQLREMLERSGFKVLRQCGVDGSRLSETKTERILTVAKKI